MPPTIPLAHADRRVRLRCVRHAVRRALGRARWPKRLRPGTVRELSRVWRAKQLEYTWLQSLMAAPRTAAHGFRPASPRARSTTRSPRSVLPLAATPSGGCARLISRSTPFRTRAQRSPRWRRARAGSCPTARCDGLPRSFAAADSSRCSTACCRSTPSTSTSRRRGSTRSPPSACACRPRASRFVSSNCWDAIGAQAFGFTTFWINRAGAPLDRHGPPPRHVACSSLAELPAHRPDRARACTGRR